MQEKLKGINLNSNPEILLETLTSATKDAIETCFPLKKMSKRAKKRAKLPWFNTDIFKDEKTQRNLFRRFIKTKNPQDHKAYSIFRNKLSKKKYRAKREYFQELLTDAKNKGDKSVTWEVINKAFGKDKRTRVYPKEVKIGEPPNTSISKDPKDVSNVLNKHFTSVASKLAKKLKKPKTKFTKYMGQENKSACTSGLSP